MTRARCPVAEEHRAHRTSHPAGRAAAHLSDLCLYHWSPAGRRASIIRYGLVPGKRSVDRAWRPPYIAFADDVALAWALSGQIHDEIPEWDLWQVFPHTIGGWELIFDTFPDTGRHFIKEYRVYERIYKRHVIYLASRSTDGHARGA